jgi:DNA-binding NtrC family response regulator
MPTRICLLVDDEPAIRTYLRTILEREELQCLEADSATQALGIVKHMEGRLDLIVTDIRMPGDIDGIDLAYSVRNSFPAIPVILISGYGDEESLRTAAAKFRFIQKPFAMDTILKAIRSAIG